MAEPRELKLEFTLKELTLSSPTENADVPGSSSTVEMKDIKLICVEYPAMVTSVERMLDTLGGEKTVSKTFKHPNRRLEMRYRPKDPFCHSLCGNRFPSSNLLLRVRRRVRKNDPKDAEIHMEVVGVIGTTYKFQGMADFQYLARHSEEGKDMSLYDKIILRKSENQEFFEKPMPYFLPPAAFSRLDSPVDYYYRPDVFQNTMPISRSNVIGLNRNRRPHNAIFLSFNDHTVPTESLEAARKNWARVCVKEHDKQVEQQIKQMFESRPIWSRNAIKANISIHPEKLKLLLPVCAYYMVTGPWRSLWVRLGYDPRKDKEAKKYQLLDFRIRCSTKHGYSSSDMPVKAKRSALYYSLPITFNKAGPHVASVTKLSAHEGPSSSRDQAPISYQLKESAYIFKEGMLPPHRQMFYQLCDLDVESIKQVIQKKGNEVCDERDGWCPVGTTDKLRDLISGMIKKFIKAQKPPMPELPKKRRLKGINRKPPNADSEEELQDDEKEDDEDDDDDEFQPSEGSENEMETEMLDYI
ncbi:general transcription factor 3C polypeptide 5 [Cheilinus undulatus]|uniref:general transcription factor 3C polypeptide 5 n=1 Tax=Cheilinus undulatus TaxID=241271 RepID=UPI001BD29E6C|nr:general transcription factor 3C polypeptide 5 [Cheilinus undulatus]